MSRILTPCCVRLGLTLLIPVSLSGYANSFPDRCRVNPDWLAEVRAATPAEPPENLLIEGDQMELTPGDAAEFRGDVRLLEGPQVLLTGSARYEEQEQRLRASDGIIYSDGFVGVNASAIDARLGDMVVSIDDAQYMLLDMHALGRADNITVDGSRGERQFRLDGGSFTTCPGEDPTWELQAGEIRINENESWGVARHAQFRILDVPVLYVPSFSFPLTDERKTGFLYPTVDSSGRSGLEVTAPYYLNLAPNYDMTLTPRYMTRRGLMGMGEFRYLTDDHEGQLNLEYLHNDQSLSSRSSRSYLRYEQESTFNDRWEGYIQFSQVSDDAYINDFGNAFANRADPHLYRQGQLDYSHDWFRAQLQFEDFQLLGPYDSPYRTLPRLSVWHDQELAPNLELDIFGEMTRFEQAGTANRTTRTHLEPQLTYRQQAPGWDWRAELSYLATHYDQDHSDFTARSTSRTMPQFRWHGQVHLERDWGDGGMQTLTPQLQYLYIPYQDQSEIGVYDTILMQEDYHSLFRPRRFTGLDRIADANQLTLGATTQFFNDRAEELLRLSLGQTFYLSDSRTQLFDDSSQITTSNSELAAELDFRLSSRWFFSTATQYDTTTDRVNKHRTAVEYRKNEDNLIQLNHRLVRGLVADGDDVEQAGLVTTWRVHNNWALASQWYRDIRSGTTMDAQVGVQYDNCCWSMRMSAYRRINRNYESALVDGAFPEAEFDNGISVQFMLTGLGQAGQSLRNMLEQGVFGYRRPFYLSN